jgi:KUP system potassium uptake protein
MSLPTAAQPPSAAHHGSFLALALGSLGVVYGDIGTSPLYALKESLRAASDGAAATPTITIGVVSLIIWTLMIIVTLKYVMLIMRADNNGEGGTLSLTALVQRALPSPWPFVALLGMAGAALFYGDSVITPAVSVLSAVEGLKLVSPAFEHGVIPISLVVLVGLFAVQASGTAAIARFFGPIMLVWFFALGLGGLPHVIEHPQILQALNPVHGVSFLLTHGWAGILALGAVFLSVTGAEALYADMGHFGRKPIQAAWTALVFPSLILCYLGQGSLILGTPEAAENPFFLLYPAWALLPMVGLATVATVIASQAVISGAFSLTQQAIQLKLIPRMLIRRTSETEKGQIFIPRANALLLVAVLLLVALFRTSENLAAAYGIAVTGTMVITAVLIFLVAWKVWQWPVVLAGLMVAPLLALDLVFLGANTLKVLEGGWLPLLLGGGLVLVMTTWVKGLRILLAKELKHQTPIEHFRKLLVGSSVTRVPGTAVFLTPVPTEVPAALLHNLKHNHVLHEHNVLLTVKTMDVPRVPKSERATVEALGDGFLRVTMRFGFMEEPNVPKAMPDCRKTGWRFDTMKTSFFLSRRQVRPATTPRMPCWQTSLFIGLVSTAVDAAEHFHLPTTRTVEIGNQISI